MRKIYTVPFGADFIGQLKDFIFRDGKDLSEIAVVFTGKRPSLYLKKRLAEAVARPVYSPKFFSIEEFIDYIARKGCPDFSDAEMPDAVWLLHQSIQSLEAFSGHPFRQKGFGEFFHWGWHLLDFIDQVDIEDIPNSGLQSVEKNAEIGYDVPESVNKLLTNISVLREAFHQTLKAQKCFTRGFKYLCALSVIQDGITLDEFERIFFAGFFALTGIEGKILRSIWEKDKADVILEGDVEEWPMLGRLVSYLGAEVERIPCTCTGPETIKLYSAFDTHSEALKVYKILKEEGAQETAIVLPSSETLFPLLTFAVDRIDEKYNISLGYPLFRTTVFDLLSHILNAQIGRRKENLYVSTDYLAVLLHPFVKNLMRDTAFRTLILHVEKLLTGEIPDSGIANKPLITLGEVEREAGTRDQESGVSDEDTRRTLLEALGQVHRIFFEGFEDAHNLYQLSEKLEQMLEFVLDNTPVRAYVLSGEIFTIMFQLLEKARKARFSRELFHVAGEENRRILCDFVLQYLKSGVLPFDTKPLETVEIIGMLESRNISFNRVIMVDVNEGIVPQPKKIDPLVPLGVYEKLGIPSPEHNEEIFRYNFYRVVRAAREVHLLYIESEDRPRSRYIEQILWKEEKTRGMMDVIPIDKSVYRINLRPQETLPEIIKTEGTHGLLAGMLYSPTKIDDYLLCPISFYYKHILRFEAKKEITEDIDATERGTIIHNILRDTFDNYKNREIGPEMFDEISAAMHRAIEKHFSLRVLTGEYYLFKTLSTYKLESFLRRTLKGAERPFVIKHLEEGVTERISIHGSSLRLKGKIDRVDFDPQDNIYTIMDYKTGGSKQYPPGAFAKTTFTSAEDLHKRVKSLQLPIYVHLFQNRFNVPIDMIDAKLVLLRTNEEEMLFKGRGQEEKGHIQGKYVEGLMTVLKDILDISKPFRPFDDEACGECMFDGLCHV